MDFKSDFKALFDKFVKHSDAVEENNRTLRDALRSLLNEDDIKELPAYTLLKMTYSPYLDGGAPTPGSSNSNSTSSNSSSSSSFDPLHAPPSARYGAKKSSDNVKRPIASATTTEKKIVSEQTEQPESHFSSQMPDMNSCLLGGSKPSVKPVIKSKVAGTPAASVAPVKAEPTKVVPVPVSPKSEDKIYRVEIQGKQYLLYNEDLYDAETRIRTGKISDIKFATTDPVELSPIPDFPNYYNGPEDEEGVQTVYILINGEIAQAVGTYEQGEVGLWT
jgi:hypothetical protein